MAAAFEHPSAERRTLRVAIVTETYLPEVNGAAMTMGVSESWTTSTCASVVPISFWMTSRSFACVAGAESRIVEFESGGLVHSAHERPDERTFDGFDLLDFREFDRFRGDARLHAIERLVRVHQENMKAVAQTAIGRGDRLDLAALDEVLLRVRSTQE